MMKKYSVEIIGISLVAFGIFNLYHDVYRGIIQTTELTPEIGLEVFVTVVFSCIAIYGGIQLFRLQEVGRKLAMI